MAKCEKLLDKALRSPASIRFSELCRLAQAHGFAEARTRGSHHIYTRPGYRRPLNFQNAMGMARAYPVRQLLDALEELGLI